MKKIKKNKKSGLKNIIKKIKIALVKCIKLGRKRMWIKGVLSGGNITAGKGFGILTWIKNIMRSTENRFSSKRKYIIEKKRV